MKKLSAYIYPQTIPEKARFSAKILHRLKNGKIRVMLLLHYLYACLRHKVVPWNFFQLNSNYFNEAKGIFSKLEMDNHIPDQWRLPQYYFDREVLPESYPVFIKPEWGQNSNGIVRINSKSEYLAFDSHVRQKNMPYIVQQTASGRIEFEIYYLRSPESPDDFAVLSITQVVNNSRVQHPINSIYNPNTTYLEITSTFSAQELQDIWNYLKAIGNFRMARVCLKADSKEDMLQGVFQIVEINLFLPMPLVLLAKNVREEKKQQLLESIMLICARLVKTIPRNETGKSIFFRKMMAHHRSLQ